MTPPPDSHAARELLRFEGAAFKRCRMNRTGNKQAAHAASASACKIPVFLTFSFSPTLVVSYGFLFCPSWKPNIKEIAMNRTIVILMMSIFYACAGIASAQQSQPGTSDKPAPSDTSGASGASGASGTSGAGTSG